MKYIENKRKLKKFFSQPSLVCFFRGAACFFVWKIWRVAFSYLDSVGRFYCSVERTGAMSLFVGSVIFNFSTIELFAVAREFFSMLHCLPLLLKVIGMVMLLLQFAYPQIWHDQYAHIFINEGSIALIFRSRVSVYDNLTIFLLGNWVICDACVCVCLRVCVCGWAHTHSLVYICISFSQPNEFFWYFLFACGSSVYFFASYVPNLLHTRY